MGKSTKERSEGGRVVKKGKGKARGRGGSSGGNDVAVGTASRPRFKRNPRKIKSKLRGKASAGSSGRDTLSTEVTSVATTGGGGGGSGIGTGDTTKREFVRDKKYKVLVKKVKESQPISRRERRELKKKRRKNYDLISQILQLWEKLRRHDLKPTERSDLLDQVMSLMKGHIYEFALKHDTARIVQCCLKYGTTSQYSTIFTELKDHIVELSKSKYAKFAVKAMMRIGTPEQRHQLIAGLYGHVHRMVRHKEASEVVETAYNDYANVTERTHLVQEFYGREFALFKKKEGEEKSLVDILTGGEEEEGGEEEVGKRKRILENMKEALTKLLDKTVVRHSIVHRALLDFLTHCDHTSRSEMVDLLKEVVVEILHTKDGSRVALQCLWYGSAKVRKVIVKSFKTYVKKICGEENGHVVMMAVFDTVDDTVLVKKNIISEMMSEIGEICDNVFGRRVILYLLSPRNRQHFSSQFLQNVLEPGDGNEHTKKPNEVRHKELLEGVTGPLQQLVKEKAADWAQNKSHSPLLLQIASSIPGASHEMYPTLVELLARDFNTEDHLIVHPSGHWVVKRLLNNEEEYEEGSLAEMIMDNVSDDHIRAWSDTNRGAFVVCSLLSSKVKGMRERMKTVLELVMKTIRTGTLEGQKALLKDITSTSN